MVRLGQDEINLLNESLSTAIAARDNISSIGKRTDFSILRSTQADSLSTLNVVLVNKCGVNSSGWLKRISRTRTLCLNAKIIHELMLVIKLRRMFSQDR